MSAKFGLERKALASALNKVSKAVPSSNSAPILRNFLVQASDSGLKISATDRSFTLVTEITEGVVVPNPGKLLLPVKETLDIVSKASDKLIAISSSEVQEDTVGIACGRTRWNLRTLRVDSYTEPVVLVPEEVHTLSRQNLLDGLKFVRKATATNNFDPSLEQVGVRAGKVVGANSIWFQQFDLTEANDLDFTIPGAVVDDLVALLSNASHRDVEVGLSASRAEMVFSVGSDTLTTHTMVKPFPDMAKYFLVPAMANNEVLTVSRDALKDSISRVRITADPSTSAIFFDLSLEDYRSMTVSSRTRTGSFSSETLPVEWVGSSRRVIFHHEFLWNLLTSFDSDVLQFKFGQDQAHKPSTALVQSDGRAGVLNQLRADMV